MDEVEFVVDPDDISVKRYRSEGLTLVTNHPADFRMDDSGRLFMWDGADGVEREIVRASA